MASSSLSMRPRARMGKGARTETSERRASDRVFLTLAAELIAMPAGARITGRMSDCCMFGCFVDTINTFPDRSTVRLCLRKGNEIFEAEAVVAYSQLRLGMGLAFTSISQENRRLLESWMALGTKQPIHGMASTALEPEHRAPTSQSERFEKLVRLLATKGILKETEARELIGDHIL